MHKITSPTIDPEIAVLQDALKNHELYAYIRTQQDINTFMEHHVFAVLDFMSILKSLQIYLTGMTLPWTPPKNAKLSRFLNEIVAVEESDLDLTGTPKSHFEMYVDAMEEAGANTETINTFVKALEEGDSPSEALKTLKLNKGISNFLNYTFQIVDSKQMHLIAALFTFGRELLLPEVFLKLIKNSKEDLSKYTKFVYYLERHIEIDGDEHGPLSIEILVDLCEDNLENWREAMDVSKKALKTRIALWDQIVLSIQNS